jgi:hypothetical protein
MSGVRWFSATVSAWLINGLRSVIGSYSTSVSEGFCYQPRIPPPLSPFSSLQLCIRVKFGHSLQKSIFISPYIAYWEGWPPHIKRLGSTLSAPASLFASLEQITHSSRHCYQICSSLIFVITVLLAAKLILNLYRAANFLIPLFLHLDSYCKSSPYLSTHSLACYKCSQDHVGYLTSLTSFELRAILQGIKSPEIFPVELIGRLVWIEHDNNFVYVKGPSSRTDLSAPLL